MVKHLLNPCRLYRNAIRSQLEQGSFQGPLPWYARLNDPDDEYDHDDEYWWWNKAPWKAIQSTLEMQLRPLAGILDGVDHTRLDPFEAWREADFVRLWLELDVLKEARLKEECVEELFDTKYAWDELVALLTEETQVTYSSSYHIIWLSDDVFLCLAGSLFSGYIWRPLIENMGFSAKFKVGDGQYVWVCCTKQANEPMPMLDRVFRLLGKERSSRLGVCPPEGENGDGLPVSMSPAALTSLLEAARSHDLFELDRVSLSMSQCRALATFRGHGTLELFGCRLPDGGQPLFEALASGKGPFQLSLHRTGVDLPSLCAFVSQTTTLRTLSIKNVANLDCVQFFQAVGKNRSLVELRWQTNVTESGWDSAFESLQTNRTLKTLRILIPYVPYVSDALGHAGRSRRTRKIVEMLRVNKTLQELQIEGSTALDQQIMRNEVRPRLRDNVCLARVKRLQQEQDDSFRLGLFSTALVHPFINGNASSTYMLLTTLPGLVSELRTLFEERDDDASGRAAERLAKRRRLRRELDS